MIARNATLATLATVVAALVSSPAAAAEAPAWQLSLSSQPTNFAPGAVPSLSIPQYMLVATNVGGASTSGEIKVEDTLPSALTPSAASIVAHVPGAIVNEPCSIAGQTVTCATSASLPPGADLKISIAVSVDSLASGSLTNTISIEGGGAGSASATTLTPVTATSLAFDFLSGETGVAAPLIESDGAAATQAGSHPYGLIVQEGFSSAQPGGLLIGADGGLRDTRVDLSQGTVVNPAATPYCKEAQLHNRECPAASQIGTVTVPTVTANPNSVVTPLYNMPPPYGTPSSFGFEAAGAGIFVHIIGRVRSDGDYGLSGVVRDALALTGSPVLGATVQLWGDPSAPSHDKLRGQCLSSGGACPVEAGETALLTAPVECTGAPSTTSAEADSWGHPEETKRATYVSADLAGSPVSVDGCNQLEFKPTIEARPTTDLADSPSGLDVTVHQPQNGALGNLSPAIMRDITLTLPEGMAVNPSSADGLGVCTEGQANVHSLDPSQCPDSAKIGTVEVTTPLLDHALPGALYVAKPFANPSGSLIAIYLAIDDRQTGVVANLAGSVKADPRTGQLSNTFTENPELPIEDIKVHLLTGPRAPLRTPPACATYTSEAEMTPWSAPQTAGAQPTDSFAIGGAPGGGPCPPHPAAAPNSPAFTAGTIAPRAGAYSPFVLKLSREDASQPLAGIEATLPPGLTGKLAGIATCSDAQLAAARAREAPEQGKAEIASPSCPASSEVGTVDVAAGAGIAPLHVQGHAYLAGPYKGAPVSLAIVTPAVAGPFDLGAVLVRTALRVDPASAQIHAVSDPLPQILEGIPLDLRSVTVTMGRPGFTLNPTSCDPMAVTGSATSAFAQVAALRSPFQVGACKTLPFKPKLSLRLKGGTKRASHPKLIATLKAKPGEANIARAQVKLPTSAFLDQAHIRTICTRVQFAADACPKGSIYGKAEASTPLLDYPLSGNVYLRSSNHKLPDLVVALRGPASQPIEIDLAGKTDSVKGALRNTFEAVPDAPVSSFRLELFGGNRGLVVNSRNLCAHRYRAEVKLDGQNGKVFDTTPVVANDCKGHGKPRHKRR